MLEVEKMKNASDILKYAMNMEKRAQEFYTFYKDKVVSQKIKELFEGLSSMEEEHYSILKKQLDSLEKNNTFDEFVLTETDGQNIILNKTKDLENVNLEYDLSDLPILRMAYSMENDFAMFYEKAIEQVDDRQAKELLKTLAKWEKEHRDSFEAEVKNAFHSSWFAQSFSPF